MIQRISGGAGKYTKAILAAGLLFEENSCERDASIVLLLSQSCLSQWADDMRNVYISELSALNRCGLMCVSRKVYFEEFSHNIPEKDIRYWRNRALTYLPGS